ncbi:hypothetical protein K5X82_13720 [Halosquirtibacter xylanolyticus]|uniref:hypothetical protein n=1 Tax=Halosquirtibacter xylanolyticus TaxID=3374599 RepID=UPI003749F450|nr:hypothetical protein K5X82_13720 [Prolixibacteraceae bacterium]
MIDITTHAHEVVKADIPLILKILIFVAIFAFTKLGGKKTKETKKTEPRRDENDVFAKIRQSVNDSIDNDEFRDNQFDFADEPFESYTEKAEKPFNGGNFHEKYEKKEAVKPTQTTNDKKYNFNESKWNKEASETKNKKESKTMQLKSKVATNKKKVHFDLRQGIIAEAVLNRKYS